jgi:NTE family protein
MLRSTTSTYQPPPTGNEPVTLLLLGSGARFPAFIGALRAIEEKGIKVRKVVGCSTGSIVASLYAAGMTPAQMDEELMPLDLARFKDASLRSMIFGKGLCAGQVLEEWLDEKLGGRVFGDPLAHPLSVVATDILNYQAVIFAAEQYPDVKISTAVRFSLGIPWVFGYREFSHRGKRRVLIDGSFLMGVAERLFERTDRTLILKTVSKRTLNHAGKGTLSLKRYLLELVTFTLQSQDKEFIRGGKWKDTILLFCSDIVPARFALAADEKRFLIDQGHAQTLQFLQYKWGI